MRQFVSIVAIVVWVSTGTQAQDGDAYALNEVAGSRIQEFVISVSDLDAMRTAFTEVFKWEVKREGPIDPTVIRFWGLPFGTAGQELLVGNAASDFGYVRLVEIDADDKELMRPGARWWDTGGLYNLNILVKDLDATQAALRDLGWTARGFKSTYDRGTAKGESQVMIGPDDLVVSFQERQAPPLQGWPAFTGATHIEVGYQMVQDLETWYAFYDETLGFEGIGMRDRPQLGPIGPNDYGLPHNASDIASYSQANVMFPRETKQSLGARAWTTAEGYDFSERIKAPNLGILSARLPVPDLDVVLARLARDGHAPVGEVQILFLEPYGAVRAALVRTPGGSGQLLTLFEPHAKPMDKSELEDFFGPGRFGNWVRFNNQMTGTVHYKAGGDARVTWQTGLDEEGTWTIKGDSICTAWYRLRDFRELCVRHYRVGDSTTQSFRIGAGPDGITTFDDPDTP